MTRELIVLLLQILAFTKAQEETVCKDGVQQEIEVPPTPPPFNCEDLEWPGDDKTFLISKSCCFKPFEFCNACKVVMFAHVDIVL